MSPKVVGLSASDVPRPACQSDRKRKEHSSSLIDANQEWPVECVGQLMSEAFVSIVRNSEDATSFPNPGLRTRTVADRSIDQNVAEDRDLLPAHVLFAARSATFPACRRLRVT